MSELQGCAACSAACSAGEHATPAELGGAYRGQMVGSLI